MAVAVVSFIVQTAAAAGAFFATGQVVFGTLLAAQAVVASALLYTGAKALFEQPDIDDTTGVRDITTTGSTEPQRIVYGETRLSGPVVYTNTAGKAGRRLWKVIALAGHPIESFGDIYLDDERAPASARNGDGTYNIQPFEDKLNTYLYDGTQVAAPPELITEFPGDWNSEMVGTGIAYIATKFYWSKDDEAPDLWPTGAPQNISVVIQGKNDVYDPRLDITPGGDPTNPAYQGYTDNPALCVADYLILPKPLGPGWDASRIDWDEIVTAANQCDSLVPIPGGNEKRFTCNGALLTNRSTKNNIQSLLTSMNGSLAFTSGKWVVRAGQFVNPGTIQLNADDLRGDISLETAPDKGERFNTVKAFYLDPNRAYTEQTSFPVTEAGFIARDGGEQLIKELGLPFTNSETMAQRICMLVNNQSELVKTMVFPAKITAIRNAVSDSLQVTLPEFGYLNKVFRVVDWKFSDGDGVDLVLREDEASAYADPTVDKYTTVSPTGAITPGEQGIPAPRSLTATGVLGGIDLIWVNPLPLSQWSTIEVWESPDNQWANAVLVAEVATDTTRREWAGGTQRWYWVRAKNEFGVVSDRFPDSDVSTVEATAVDPAGASGTYGTIEASNGVGWHQNTSGVWSPPGLTTDLSVTFQRSATALASAIVTVTNDGNGLLTGAITTPDADITVAFVGQGTSGLTTSFTYTPDNVTVSQFVQSGADGQDGAGSDANLIQLTYTAQTFSYDNSTGTPVLIGPSDIDFFLNKQNVADPTTWNVFDSTGADLGDAPLSSVTDTSAILTAASFGAITNNSEVEVVATAGIYQDRTTIVELLSGTDGLDGDNGEDATSGYLTNEAHTVPTDPDGSNPILDDAKGLFKFFVGITDVTNGAAFSIVNSAGGTFRINVGVNNPVAGQPRGYYDMTSMTQNNAVATFRATFGGVSIDKDFTVAKSIAGQVGDPGPTGADGKPGTPGVSVVLPYNNNETTVNVAGEYGFKTSGGTRIDSWAILTDPAGVLDNIEIYKFDQNGVDHSAYLESIQVGTTLTWYDSRRRWLEYRTQTAVDAGAFMRYDLELVEFDEADGSQDIPTGIYPIELWFSQGLKGADGTDTSTSIRTATYLPSDATITSTAWTSVTNTVLLNIGAGGLLDYISSGTYTYSGGDPAGINCQIAYRPQGGTWTVLTNPAVNFGFGTITIDSVLGLGGMPASQTTYEFRVQLRLTSGSSKAIAVGTSQQRMEWTN